MCVIEREREKLKKGKITMNYVKGIKNQSTSWPSLVHYERGEKWVSVGVNGSA